MIGTRFRKTGLFLALLFPTVLAGCGGSDDLVPLVSAVFDIDGTLTPDELDFGGVRPNAVEAVWSYVSRGYAVVYVTARPDALRGFTVDYLRDNGFPNCPLFTAYGNPLNALLSSDEIALYKTDTLFQLMESQNRTFQFGYGDSGTDFQAWSAAFIPSENIYALLRCPDDVCEKRCEFGDYPPQNCLNGYTDRDHLGFIQSLSPVNAGQNTQCGAF